MKNKSVFVMVTILSLFFLLMPFEAADALMIKNGDRIEVIDSTDQIYEGKISSVDSNSVSLADSANIRLDSNEIKQVYVWKRGRPGSITAGFFIGFTCGFLTGYI